MSTKTGFVRIDRSLLDQLRKIAVEKHGKLHGSLKAEIDAAIEEYLRKNEEGVKK
jgi:hypothetical protein